VEYLDPTLPRSSLVYLPFSALAGETGLDGIGIAIGIGIVGKKWISERGRESFGVGSRGRIDNLFEVEIRVLR